MLEERKNQRVNEWVFPSDRSSSGHLEDPKKALKRVCREAEINNFRIHDLRRTIPSWMAMNGANQYMISKVLNHTDPRSTIVYARLSVDAVREFMQKAINDVVICRKDEKNSTSPLCDFR